ncbi:MAG: hypothetical protein ACRDZ4_00545, partial [Egibacteraceae bacterium]
MAIEEALARRSLRLCDALGCGFGVSEAADPRGVRLRRALPAAVLPSALIRRRWTCGSSATSTHPRSSALPHAASACIGSAPRAPLVVRRAVRYGDAPRAALRRARKARRARIPGRATNEEARRNAASVDAGSLE